MNQNKEIFKEESCILHGIDSSITRIEIDEKEEGRDSIMNFCILFLNFMRDNITWDCFCLLLLICLFDVNFTFVCPFDNFQGTSASSTSCFWHVGLIMLMSHRFNPVELLSLLVEQHI